MNTISTTAQEFKIVKDGKLFIAPTKTKDVVAVEGSVLGGENMLPKQWSVVPNLAADLFDAGTKGKKKAILRDGLATRGISLAFSSAGDRTYFSGSCFPEDLSFLFQTIVECLKEANFPEAELKALKQRTLGELAEEKTETNGQATRALTQLMYESSHPNYVDPIAVTEEAVRKAKRAYLENFKKMIGKGGLVLSVVGDVEPTSVQTLAEKAFSKLGQGTLAEPEKRPNKKSAAANEKLIYIPDKANIDVLLGASIPITKKAPLYYPTVILADMLGGGFAGHLMQTIRERDGLTYRTYARLAGLTAGTDGYLEVYASFNPGRYEESVAKLKKEVKMFFAAGLTDAALARKKEEIAGSYLVGLSTTRGLARALHSIGVEGRELSYLSEYPNIIQAVSLMGLHHAADLIPLSKLSLAAAGTFPKK